MSRHGIALLGLAIVAIAVWTYSVNYNTRMMLDRVADLNERISLERETLQVLRVEWAHLSSPDRLERLVALHNDKLQLVPITAAMLGEVGQPPFVPENDEELLLGEGFPLPRARPASWILE